MKSSVLSCPKRKADQWRSQLRLLFAKECERPSFDFFATEYLLRHRC